MPRPFRFLCRPTALLGAVAFMLAIANGASAQAPTTCTSGPDTFLVADQCPAAGAAIKVVTSTAASGAGSLADSVATAQAGDVVVFAASLVADAPATITLAAPLVLDKALTILGPGPGLLTVSGGGAVRVLEVTGTGTVTVADIRITGGSTSNPTGHGGGIRNGGTLTLQRSHVLANRTQNNTNGAGIANFGTLTVLDSLIANNVAGQYGGALHNAGSALLRRTTLRANTAGSDVGFGLGGALDNHGTLTVEDSLLEDNGASSKTDHLMNQGLAIFVGSTIKGGNVGMAAGAMQNGAVAPGQTQPEIRLVNSTLVAYLGVLNGGKLTVTQSTVVTIDTPIEAYPTNLFPPGSLAASSVILRNSIINGRSPAVPGGSIEDGPNDINESPGLERDSSGAPRLRYNGGPTPTIFLLPGSLAINAGDNTRALDGSELGFLSTDQRGFARIVGDTVDLGAVEYAPLVDTDADGVPDVRDNCIADANANQADGDGDGIGDACDGDRTLPTITILAPVSGGTTTYARNAAVLADYACADADSGVATCEGTVANGTAIDTATAGDKTFAVEATDNAGNSHRAEVVYTVVRSTPVVTWATPASVPYGTALGDAQLNATADVAGTFLYSPTAGTVLDAGQRALSVTFTPDDAANYYAAPKVVTLTVTPVTPTLSWAAPAPIAYGTPLPASVLAATATSSVTQATVPGTFEYSVAANAILDVGTHTLSVTFHPANATNFLTATASVQIEVGRAKPVIGWPAPASIVYLTSLGATQLNATATAPGSGVSLPGQFAYDPAPGTVLTAGTHTLSVVFTPTDSTRYEAARAERSIEVTRATPVVTWAQPAAITYGTALGGAQLNASSTTPGSVAYTPGAGTVLDAGVHQLSATFTPIDLDNFAPVTVTRSLQVNRATPVLTWLAPAPIVLGTPLGATQLAAVATMPVTGAVVPGGFVYTPAAGTVLPAGAAALSAVFVPADAVNFTGGSVGTTIVVNAPPLITSVNGPSGPVAINTAVTVSAAFSDGSTGDTHTCRLSWDDGAAPVAGTITAAPSTCTGSRSFAVPGVYQVGVTVVDDDGLSASAAFQYVVVYDPSAGFVTGRGRIESPVGALTSAPELTGPASFGFVSRYRRGETTPVGDTEFTFAIANFAFQSSSYQWLVVAGPKAQYKGVGAVNGLAGFGFLLTANDGQAKGGGGTDRFRIKIWRLADEGIVYDNALGASDDIDAASPQAITNGAIVINAR